MKSVFLQCVAFILVCQHCVDGEIISNKGTHFVVAFLPQIQNSKEGNNLIFISTEFEAKVRIQVPGLRVSSGRTFDRSVNVSRGRITVELPGAIRMDRDAFKEMKGVQITSDEPVVVHGMNIYGNSSDSFLALPLGVTKPNSIYIVSTFVPKIFAVVLVVAAEADTEVTFTIRSTEDIHYNGKDYSSGDNLTVKLGALECFQLTSFGDLTGTRVTSVKPISVFSGNDCASVPSSFVLCDHLVEQIPPVDLWGNWYFTTPTVNTYAKDYYYIVASRNKTTVMINSTKKAFLAAGEKYIYSPLSGSADVIRSEKPILVVKFAQSQRLDGVVFDPFMAVIPAKSQFATEYLTFVPGKRDRTFVGYANLVIKTEQRGGIKIDINGRRTFKIFPWATIPGTLYSWCSVKLPAESSMGAFYYIYHTSPAVKFGAFMYGTVKTAHYHESYGCLGGFRVDRPESPCRRPSMTPADGLDNDCDNRIDEEILNGIDDDGDGSIDEDLATERPTLIVPPDVTYKGCVKNSTASNLHMIKRHANGKCVYRGGVALSVSEIEVRAQCSIRIARKFSVRDACGNVVNKTQHVTIRYPFPDVEFPPDKTLTCRPTKDLIPALTGRAQLVRKFCSGLIKLDFSDNKPDSCQRAATTLYRVWRVREDCGRVSSHTQRIDLLHGVAPLISYYTPNIELSVGKNVTLPCKTTGSPLPEHTWVLPNGTSINVSSPVYAYEVGAADDDLTVSVHVKKVLQDGSLLLSRARVYDSGKYTCIARNSMGKDRKSTTLTVRKDIVEVDVRLKLEQETFDEDLRNRSSLKYQTLEAKVTKELTNIFQNITGFQRVEILQFINGSVDVLFRVVVKVDDPKAEPPQVVAKKVGEKLSVKVKSGYLGDIKVSPVVEFREKPPPPRNVTIGDVKHNQVNVFWVPPNLHQMYQVKDYSLQYKEFGNPKWHTFIKTQVLNYRLPNLKSGTGYAVRVKAHNKYDVSDPSEPVELITLKEKSTTDWLLLVLVPILCILLVAVLGYIVYWKLRKRHRKSGYAEPVRMNEILQQQNEEQERQNGTGTTSFRKEFCNASNSLTRYSTPPGNLSSTQMMLAASDTVNTWREIPRDEIRLGRILGEGEYGMVMQAELRENSGIMQVAVKKLKRTATESDFKDLLNELELLSNVGSHPNIVNLIGACTLNGPLMVVVEYAEHGNLLNFLRENRKQNYENLNECQLLLSVADRLKIAGEVARGMAHLAVMKCVHRDLAARNVLLDEKYVAKVSDFGLSRDVYTNNVYQKTTAGKLPAKWMAIEAIESGIYSSQSDVWSFGVLLWEIETGGKTPYPAQSVKELLKELKLGVRLDKPSNCDEKLYQMMRRCWCPDPSARPTFDELCTELKSMYNEATDYLVPSDIGMLPSYQNISLA